MKNIKILLCIAFIVHGKPQSSLESGNENVGGTSLMGVMVDQILQNGEIEKLSKVLGDDVLSPGTIDEFIKAAEQGFVDAATQLNSVAADVTSSNDVEGSSAFAPTEAASLENNVEKFEWANWEEWTDCTVTCGIGQRKRIRLCLKGSDVVYEMTECYEKDQTLESVVEYCSPAVCPTLTTASVNSTEISEPDVETEAIETEEDSLIDSTTVVPDTEVSENEVGQDESIAVTEVVTEATENEDDSDSSIELTTVSNSSVSTSIEDVAETEPADAAVQETTTTQEITVATVDETQQNVTVTANATNVSLAEEADDLTTPEILTTSVDSDENTCIGADGGVCGCHKGYCWSYCNLIPSVNWFWCWTDSPLTEQSGKTECEEHAECQYNWSCHSWCGA